MTIEVREVKDKGDINKERVIINVISNDDIGRYIIFDTTYFKDESISNEIRHSLWFTDKKVEAGDLVVVYTKKGKESEIRSKNGAMTYFFYMNLKESIWNKAGDCAVLIEVKNWESKPV